MKAIIVAAGLGIRLSPLTDIRPKCLLRLGDKTLLERQLAVLRECGVEDIALVRGHGKELITYPGVRYYDNDNYENNNILGSLFYAEAEMSEEFIFSYSDIVYDRAIVERLLASEDDVAVVVDTEWKSAYQGRTDHPVAEAEKALVEDGRVIKIGKSTIGAESAYGEFIGMARFSARGAETMKSVYWQAAGKFAGSSFQHEGRPFEKAYLTDILQEMIDRGHTVKSVDIAGGWREIDTLQDYQRAEDWVCVCR